MYPRNAASPERISIGPVVLIADGTVQTSGVAIKVIPFGAAEATGGGTIAYSADGVVMYTPTQAETDYTSMIFVASKAACIPANTTIVTSAASVAGQSFSSNMRGTDGANTIAPATPANVTASTSTIAALLPVALVGGRIDASVGAVAANAINAASIAANAIGTATFAAGTTIPRVTLADTTTTNTDMRGTDGANTVAPTNLSAAQVRTELATELGRIDASVSSRSTYAGGAVASVTAAVALDAASVTAVQSGLATPADINAQMLDVLSVDTFAELSSPPAATSSLKDKLTWMFQWFRNKSTETATERKLFADDTTTVISTEAVSDDGTTFTKNEAS